MIFVTIGSQLPFDRMIQAVDEIAPLFPGKEFIAQAFGLQYKVKNIQTLEFISPVEFNDYIRNAELVISHAGTGTILSVGELGKPLIVFPRLGKLKETRNNHQVDTCVMLEKSAGLNVAYDKQQLQQQLEAFFRGELKPMEKISPYASTQLLTSLRDFVSGGRSLVAG